MSANEVGKPHIDVLIAGAYQRKPKSAVIEFLPGYAEAPWTITDPAQAAAGGAR
jgi:hypothetical protein